MLGPRGSYSPLIFRVYLSGRAFKVQTDSSALTYLQRFKEGNAILMRWALKLQSQLNIEGDTPTGMMMALAGSSSHTTKRVSPKKVGGMLGCGQPSPTPLTTQGTTDGQGQLILRYM